MNHRGGEIGYYKAEQTGATEVHVYCKNPYACPFDRGIIEAAARKFKPAVTVPFVTEVGDTCRLDGDDKCTYQVRWDD